MLFILASLGILNLSTLSPNYRFEKILLLVPHSHWPQLRHLS